MKSESSPPSNRSDDDEAAMIRRMLAARRIAIVGLSDDPFRPSFRIANYLLSVGKQIIPINPAHDRVLGVACYGSLEQAPAPIDLVDVFRRPEFCADVVRAAVAIGARGVWLQSGIRSDEARSIARRAGIDFVQDRCIMIEHLHQPRAAQ